MAGAAKPSYEQLQEMVHHSALLPPVDLHVSAAIKTLAPSQPMPVSTLRCAAGDGAPQKRTARGGPEADEGGEFPGGQSRFQRPVSGYSAVQSVPQGVVQNEMSVLKPYVFGVRSNSGRSRKRSSSQTV